MSSPIVVGGILIAVVASPIIMLMKTPSKPAPQFEMVMACKPPFLRRTKEYILRDPGTGSLVYQTHDGIVRPLAPGVSPEDACKRRG